MKQIEKVIEAKEDTVMYIGDVTITSNIDDEGVREYVTECICKLTKEFNKKFAKDELSKPYISA